MQVEYRMSGLRNEKSMAGLMNRPGVAHVDQKSAHNSAQGDRPGLRMGLRRGGRRDAPDGSDHGPLGGPWSGPKKAPQPKDFSGWIGCSGGPPGALPGALDPAIGCAFFCHHDWSGQKPKIRILKPFQKRFPFFQKCSKPTFEYFGLFTAIRRTKGISTNIFWGLPP